MDIDHITSLLAKRQIETESGLSSAEFSRVESTYKFVFPPDLRRLLSSVLPIGESFIHWRHVGSSAIQDRLNWPFEGIKFDIENNNFWMNDWGARPENLAEAVAVAKTQIGHAPILIPIYGHRYIPAEPNEPGNPVFSVYQTDIIYYGSCLTNYFENEFRSTNKTELSLDGEIRDIRFWSALAG